MRRISLALVLAMIGIALAAPAGAHGPVKRTSEIETGEQARLFTADAATGDVIALDLPDASRVTHLPTPPFVMSMAVSGDRAHLYAMRGRDTDRDWITVIDTGIDRATGEVRPPFIARTLLGHAPTTGGVHDGKMPSIGGKDALYMDKSAEIVVFQNDDFNGYEGLDVRRYKLARPDHYHALEAGDNIYIGHLRLGLVQILNRESGKEVARLRGCPALHGIAFDLVSARMFFGCAPNMLVVGTRGAEMNKEVGRIVYPENQRVAAFLKGKNRIFWGYTEGTLPQLYRLDLAKEPYAFDTLPVPSSIQVNVSPDGALLLVLTRAGVLEIRDGGTGAVLREVHVAAPFAKDFHEHTDKAVLPAIEVLNGRAYVSLPLEGKIAEVDLESGKVLKNIETGGEPTRIVLVPWPPAKDHD